MGTDIVFKLCSITPKREHRVCTWASQAGAAFSNPSTSELARDCEKTSLIRRADGTAALRAGSFRRKYGVVLGLPSGEMF